VGDFADRLLPQAPEIAPPSADFPREFLQWVKLRVDQDGCESGE
jgi:hypothetical protein